MSTSLGTDGAFEVGGDFGEGEAGINGWARGLEVKVAVRDVDELGVGGEVGGLLGVGSAINSNPSSVCNCSTPS
jgi:hypothetical protein